MSLPSSINDLEKGKFRDAGSSGTKVAVILEGGSLTSGYTFNKITASYPSSTIEQYDYTLAGILQLTIVVEYTDSSKSTFLSQERTYGI